MKRQTLSALVASWTAVGLIACDRDQASVEQVAAPPAEESRMLDRATEAVKGASERVGEAATATRDAASDAAAAAMDRADGVRGHAEAQTREMIGRVKSFLAEDQKEVARELMNTLSAMKDSLSDGLRAEIERLEAMFSEA
ncbi:exported hypothetical protein [Thiocapsa sp. KS1]|nr:hypothetical protein [Thiocapsa sp. KS1]CRI64368.1 exported hypothetical protein [Thiocapsa sp. KS1]